MAKVCSTNKIPKSIGPQRINKAKRFTTNKEAQKYIDTKDGRYVNKLLDSEADVAVRQVDALEDYSFTEYKRINSALRRGTTLSRNMQKTVTAIDEVIDGARALPNDVVAYRGLTEKVAKMFQPGTIIRDDAFVSTTLNEKTAAHFADFSKNEFVLEVILPKGTKCVGMPDFLSIKEQELLLARGTRFRVLERTEAGRIRVEVIQ